MSGGRPEYGLLDALLDDDGNPPCPISDDCPTCRLFSKPRDGETWADWLARMTEEITR